MSDIIKHECGIAMVRLRKPISYFREKYGTPLYGLNKLYLLMEKQHNRGQDGAGIATVKLDMPPGTDYLYRLRSLDQQPIKDIFSQVYKPFAELQEEDPHKYENDQWLKDNIPYHGELLLGHLRYGTHGQNSIETCHPFLRQNNWMTRNLAVAGNFNMTNAKELYEQLVRLGQHPVRKSDTITVLEKIGHFLDTGVQVIFDRYKDQGYDNAQITNFIIQELDLQKILRSAAKDFDGGYAMAGLLGHGDAFVLRDPSGIRPAYYYSDEEVAVVASERPAIQTSFNVPFDKIREVSPGHALIIKKDGSLSEKECVRPLERRACSFERIYFSRGTDKEIYKERKDLGYLLTEKVLEATNYDYANTVYSFIPNTAEVAFLGLVKGLEEHINKDKIKQIEADPTINGEKLHDLLNMRPRVEKIAVKDVKMRTFITEDASRDEMVSHVYDITYGSVNGRHDTLVVVDDSIVRGTTLERSILSILDRLNPKKIIVVSSAPQIRYPDCYGIDMSKMHQFIAFRAMVALLEERGLQEKRKEVYRKCKDSENLPLDEVVNHVKELYDLFTDEEVSAKISEIVRPKHIFSDVQIIYQSVDALHQACPGNLGDWYFTGNYPTPGGRRVVNRAFINYMEGKDERAY